MGTDITNPDPFVLTDDVFAHFENKGIPREEVINYYHQLRGPKKPLDDFDAEGLDVIITDLKKDIPMFEGESHNDWVKRVIKAFQESN